MQPSVQLPVVLPAAPDELLSSWIGRHAAFYAVPPLVMLRHCLDGATSLWAADRKLTRDQAEHIGAALNSDPAAVCRSTFAFINPTSRRMVAAGPIQICPECTPKSADSHAAIKRHQLLGWRLTCPLCKGSLGGMDGRLQAPSPFLRYAAFALQGEALLHDEAEHGSQTWASPVDIVRLLLMRRNPNRTAPGCRPANLRVLGVAIPEFDAAVRDSGGPLASAATPILPLHLRSALLAGVAIVHREGLEMLEMLQAHMIGENRTRFGELVRQTINRDHGCAA